VIRCLGKIAHGSFHPTGKELVMHELPILNIPIGPITLPADSQVTLPEWQLALLAGDDN
jgi:hypothetical protein